MTFAAGFALFLQAAAQPVPLVALPPADWSKLPELALLRLTPPSADLSDYVRDEVLAGRCVAAGSSIRVDLAVMIGSDGRAKRIVPRAINCPTVEQYASGIISRMTRQNVIPPPKDSWYRTAVTFSWTP